MKAQALLANLGLFADVAGGSSRLRELILALAMRGRVVDQLDTEGEAPTPTFEDKAVLTIDETGGAPHEIPRSWRWWPLDRVFEPISSQGKKILVTEVRETGKYPVVDQGQVLIRGYTDRDDVVIRPPRPVTVFGDHTRQVKYVDFPFVAGADGTKILLPKRIVDPQFFFWCIRALRIEGRGYGRHYALLLENQLPLPPLAEQKRIVAKVDQLMALCDDLEAKQTKKRDLATQSTRSALSALTTAETADDLAAAWRRVAKNFGDVLGDTQGILALKDAVLALAVRGQIGSAAPGDESIEHVTDRLSRARDASAAKARGNHDALPEVEDVPFEVARWRWIRLGNFAEIVGGVAKGRKLAGRQVTSFPYLRVANVQRGFLDLTVMKELEIPREELPRYRLLPNDVLFTEGGDWDKLGRSAVWPGEIDPCIHQNHIFRARLLTKDIDPRWVSMFCNSPVGRAYFEDAAKQTTNLATINMTELRHCPIPVPPPQEQRRILDRLHQITSLLDDLEAKLRKQEETATRLAESLAAAVAG